jgi:hypothetical protein
MMSWAMNPDFELLLSSPENECRHGRCPGDTSPKCGCWADLEGPQRRVKTPPILLAEARKAPVPDVIGDYKARRKRRRTSDVLAAIAEAA